MPNFEPKGVVATNLEEHHREDGFVARSNRQRAVNWRLIPRKRAHRILSSSTYCFQDHDAQGVSAPLHDAAVPEHWKDTASHSSRFAENTDVFLMRVVRMPSIN